MDITYALSPKDAAKSLGISRATLYRLINTGRLRVVKIGSRSVIPASCLLALLDEPSVNAEVVS
jgi:excisionase family DNA binding protein